jgi:phage protein U
MLVQSDEGWKVWVSMPVSLTDVEIERDGKTTRVNAGKGDKIQFDASLERSQDDAKFAFGKRPTKASVVEWGE